MAELTFECQVQAPPERVFAAAIDLQRAPQRIPSIRRLEVLTPGPVGKGTRFRETRLMFGREHTEEMEVVAVDPPRSYVVGAESCGCRYRTELRFTPRDGGTQVAMLFRATPLTLIAKVMSVLLRPTMRKMLGECAKDLQHLKAAVERE